MARAVRFSKDLDDRFDRRESKSFSDRLGMANFRVAWDADVVSIEGAHYHFWIPKRMEKQKNIKKEFLEACKSAATWQGDPVSYSYSYLPEGVDIEPIKRK